MAAMPGERSERAAGGRVRSGPRLLPTLAVVTPAVVAGVIIVGAIAGYV
jgi:hypothetical protein